MCLEKRKIKAEEETEDMYSALDLVVDKLEKQIKRHREKLKIHNKGPISAKRHTQTSQDHDLQNDELDTVTADRIRDLTLSQMTFEEAAEKLTHSSTPFVVFLDNEDNGLRLLFQAPGGTLELLRFHN
jgi:putative sigma-54 modulation protein